MRSTSASSLLAVLVTALAPAALAERATDPAAAEALFTDAKALMRTGEFAKACPKLAESQKLDPAVGTELALALCYENWGKLASAWASYRDAAAAARHAKQPDRERIAADRARALEGRLGALTLLAPSEVTSASGLAVDRDGIPLGAATFGTATPIDAGEHVVTVRASGKKPVTLRVTVADGEKKVLNLPPLEDALPPQPAAPSAAPAHDGDKAPASHAPGSSARRTLGFGLVGLAVVGVGFGTYFGVRALNQWSDAKAACSPGACPRHDDAAAMRSDAITSATLANVTLGVGLVAAVAGAYFLLTSGSGDAEKNAVTVGCAPMPRGGAGTIQMRF